MHPKNDNNVPEIVINYRKKRNSSGRLRHGKILLSIAKGLSRQEEARHISTLSNRLLKQWEKLSLQPPELKESSDIKDDQALQCLAAGINEKYYQFSLSDIRFYKQNSLWGSCNWRKGSIHISHRLKGAPLPLIYYVVAHELAHLKEPNHGPKFWELVQKACANYKQVRQWLKNYEVMGEAKG